MPRAPPKLIPSWDSPLLQKQCDFNDVVASIKLPAHNGGEGSACIPTAMVAACHRTFIVRP